jgi:hypothetical protein
MTRPDFLAPPSLRILGTQASLAGAEPKLTALNTYELPDGALVFVSSEKAYFYFDRDSTALPDGTDVIQATGPGRFRRWTGSGPVLATLHEMIVPSVAGKSNYTIPVGNWCLAAPGQTFLDINTGTGWIEQGLGPDYGHLLRVTPPPTVADAAIGFSLNGSPPAGWLLRFRWFERTLLVNQPSIAAKVLQPPNYTVEWLQNGPFAANAPNGVRVPEYPNVQVEFWRQSWRNGGVRGNSGTLRREGKRYLPYFRGALNQFTFAKSEFCYAQGLKRNHYRVCYYDPTNGARSALSNDIIVVCSTQQDDRVNGRVARRVGSLWIE